MKRRRILQLAGLGIGSLAGCQELGKPKPSPTPDNNTSPNQTNTQSHTGAISVSWTTGPDMFKRRTQTTAVALNGQIYVIGGIVESETRHTAVFDPQSNDWHKVPPPPKPINHTSAVAHKGRIHVFGGYSGSFLGSNPLAAHWIYDPATNAWSTGPPLPTPRGALIAVAINDRIFTIGGATKSGTTAVVEAFNP
ncbi:MAG: kelch repeat-containing protein, partial [Halobacteriaceae archaeon]